MSKTTTKKSIKGEEMKIETKELTPADWSDLEKLFGSNGACGGCWCMSWRTEKGEKWEDIKGVRAKQRQRNLVESGKTEGVLAYIDNDVVGWCSFGRRVDFPKLNRAPSLKCDDADRVWSIPCFFIKSGHRNRGVATALLAQAVKALRKRKAEIIEGYPVKQSTTDGNPIPAAFAWTGTESLFSKAGFKVVGSRDGGKLRVRLEA